MTEERTSSSSSAAAEDAAGPPRAFPVPRNRPVLPALEGFEEVEHEGTAAAPTPHRRALEVMLILALAALIVLGWLITRPADKPVPAAQVVEVRVPTDDPAVETYFTPSQPEELPPVEDDRTPLPPPVSLDELFGSDER